jgi:tRNA nucleotidyltransferase (CCA-adding enzyme)
MEKMFNFAEQVSKKYGILIKIAEFQIDKSKINPKAIEACKMLQDKGFESYLVGGCVRDLLMNTKPKDWDICTNAKPEQMKQVFPKTYDTGIQHGTITVSLGPTPQDMFEVTTYRTEGDYSDGRRPDFVAFVNDINEDLARRDLTINSMAYDPVNDKIVDPYGGQSDLKNRVIKAVGNPNDRFQEDGLRTMRVARFAARLGFTVDPGTQQAITNNLDVLSKVSKERMRDELTKTLVTSHPSVGLAILLNTGAMGVLGTAFNSGIVASTFSAIDSSQGSMETKMAILLHKLNRPELESTLRELKFSNDEIKKIVFLNVAMQEFVKFHSESTPVGARKFLSFIKNNAPEGYEKSLAEFLDFAKSLGLPARQELEALLTEAPIHKKELDISGNDLMTELNLKPGPKIKQLLDHLYGKVAIEKEENRKDRLLELAREFESKAMKALRTTMCKTGAEKEWWRLSDPEEADLLRKKYEFGEGRSFEAGEIPDIAKQVEVPAGLLVHHPEKNQLLHTNLVYDQARKKSNDPMVWLAAVLHDVGKSYTDKNQWPKQHGHEEIGVPYTEKICDLLGVPPEWKEFAKLVTEYHLTCHIAEELSPAALHRLFDLFKNDKQKFIDFVTTCESDSTGRLGFADKPYPQKDYLLKRWDEGIELNPQKPSTLAISGNDLMKEFGLKPGPELGKILKSVKELVEKNPEMNERQILMDFAKTLLVRI